MRDFFILVIEDDPDDRKRVTDAIELSTASERVRGIRFMATPSDNWEHAESLLKANRYDLVIADLFVFKDSAEREAGGRGAFDCKDALLEITESESPPVPVVFYTDKLSLSNLESYQSRICEFWHKEQVDEYFLAFRVRKIRDLLERERPGDLLIRSIREKLTAIAPDDTTVLWRDRLNEILAGYETYGIRTDQTKAMTTPIHAMAVELGFSECLRQGLSALRRIDIPASTLMRHSRPHYFHSLNTFLLGYYLFALADIHWKDLLLPHCRMFDAAKIGGKGKKAATETAWNETMAAWFAAGLLHDIGVSAAGIGDMFAELSELEEMLGVTEKADRNGAVSLKKDILAQTWSRFGSLKSDEGIVKFLQSMGDRIDHGLVSGLFLAHRCYDEAREKLRDDERARFLLVAAEAASLHNSFTEAAFPVLDFSTNPVAAMLVLCDAIQAWGREREDFGILREKDDDKRPVEQDIARVELCELASQQRKGSGPGVSVVVRYYLHSFLARHRPTSDGCKSDLGEILDEHVVGPLRKKLVFSGPKSLVPHISIHFFLGADLVTTCEIPVSASP
jgi:hypothetical protein